MSTPFLRRNLRAVRPTAMLSLLVAALLLVLTGCDGITEVQTSSKAETPETLTPLPLEGITLVPDIQDATYPPQSFHADSAEGAAALTPAERREIAAILTTVQQTTGSDYVAFISQRKRNGTYRYRSRVLAPPQRLTDAAGGATRIYVYRFKLRHKAQASRMLVALIPDVDEATTLMNQWVGVRPPKGSASSIHGQRTTPTLAAKAQAECTYSEQLVFYEELGTWGYELLEVCDTGSGGEEPVEEPVDEPTWPEETTSCTDPFGCDEGGGTGETGGTDDQNGGGSSGEPCDPDAIDQGTGCEEPPLCTEADLLAGNSCGGPGDMATKVEIADAIRASCSTQTMSDEDVAHAFSNSVRRALNMQHRPGGSINELDGYTQKSVFGHQRVTAIMEAKFTERTRPFSFGTQTRLHIDELSKVYTAIPADGVLFGGPVYMTVSLNPNNKSALDPQNQTIPYAESKGVGIVNVVVRQGVGGKYFLWGEAATNASLISTQGFQVDWPQSLSVDVPMSSFFDFDCQKDK